MKKTLNIAVVGAGHLGTIHTRLLHQNPRFTVAGVVDPSESAREKITNEFSVPTFEDFSQIDAHVDAAIVAASTNYHYPIVQYLLEKNIHVLVEKPITVSLEQANQVVDAAEHRKLVLQVGHNERFNATFVAATKHQPSVRYFEAARTSSYTFRSIDVGVVLDLMIHDLDLLLSMVDSPLIQVNAVGQAVFGQHEDIAQARLQFANGTVANLTASRCSFERNRWCRWFSEKGFVSANLDANEVKSIAVPSWLSQQERDLNSLPADQQATIRDSLFEETLPLKSESIDPVNAIDCEHNDFYESIQVGREPTVSGRDGRDALAAAEMILDSIQQHRWMSDEGSPTIRKAA